MSGVQAAMVGRRLHLQHGPIDLLIVAEGEGAEVRAAYAQARAALEGVLEGLVAELPTLRRDVRVINGDAAGVSSQVARSMMRAVTHHEGFVTPMAAVAGAVADHVLAAMRAERRLSKAMVNNGGDVALWLDSDETATVGVGDMREDGVTVRPVTLSALDGIGGIATSGWRGRSHSLGIADYVTVFAKDAATADVAATLIANAVDLPGSPKVTRRPATDLSPDSDLGARSVTVAVDPLSDAEAQAAVAAGRALAKHMASHDLIVQTVIGLQGTDVSCTREGSVFNMVEAQI